ncbi:hypothetical protein CDAR_401251 [Caerostris darwini]|uniref:Uncharacterized protein n=1 Tax=Caerostris darwini TaxID=1538125 RepID=A0AAV4RSC2_9ARAC|nr:hypothetical protein CDAR_401251 [Caerostris darwini]
MSSIHVLEINLLICQQFHIVIEIDWSNAYLHTQPISGFARSSCAILIGCNLTPCVAESVFLQLYTQYQFTETMFSYILFQSNHWPYLMPYLSLMIL